MMFKTDLGMTSYLCHDFLVSQRAGVPSTTRRMPDGNMGLDMVSFFGDTVCKIAILSAYAVN